MVVGPLVRHLPLDSDSFGISEVDLLRGARYVRPHVEPSDRVQRIQAALGLLEEILSQADPITFDILLAQLRAVRELQSNDAESSA